MQTQLCTKKSDIFSFSLLPFREVCDNIFLVAKRHPGVAKFGIALEWGSRGLEFESQHSDHKRTFILIEYASFYFLHFRAVIARLYCKISQFQNFLYGNPINKPIPQNVGIGFFVSINGKLQRTWLGFVGVMGCSLDLWVFVGVFPL